MFGDIQYIADSYLLEKTFKIISSNEDEALTKYAFDLGSFLGDIGSSIKQFIGGQVHGQDSGGVTRTVVNFLAPALFFRLHPILGLLVTAAQLFGFDLYSVYQRIVDSILPAIQSGQQVSAQQINDVAKSAIPTFADDDTSSADDLLSPLRELEANGSLNKIADFSRDWKSQPFIPKNSNPFLRMFSFFGKRRGSNLIVGILVWFLKTVLLSAGLLAVGGAVVGLVSGNKDNNKPEQSTTMQTSISPRSTGAGSKVFKNNPGDLWIENLGSDKPHERVLKWAFDSYPDLYEYKDIILRTSSFWDAVRKITQNWNPGQEQLVIPDPYKSRDEILALFINDVFRAINQSKGK